MQIHPPSPMVGDDDFPTSLHRGASTFAVIVLRNDIQPALSAQLYMQTTADCDRLIKAATEAKRLLAEAGAE